MELRNGAWFAVLTVTLRLEGKLSDQWVGLLEGECRELLRHKKTVHLDFSGVDYMDERGAEMVQSLPREHVRVLNTPPFIQGLVEPGGRLWNRPQPRL